MAQDRAFERKYSLNIARLKQGEHQESFDIDQAFFEQKPESLIREGQVRVDLDMVKYGTHLDVKFHLAGQVHVPCDRCGEPYPQEVELDQRIIYAFSPSMKFDGHEVIYVDPDEPALSLVQELYDFAHLALPMRRVPDPSIHTCSPDVLAVLGLDAEGNPLPESEIEDEEDREPDERWAALKKLRDQMDP